jgi:hypothetical protein
MTYPQGVLEKTHETMGLTGKMHMRGYFRGTPGRAKFSYWYRN